MLLKANAKSTRALASTWLALLLKANAYSTGKYCAADFCATMAKGHAQKGAKQYFSCGYTCYALFLIAPNFNSIIIIKYGKLT
jgi:hypothetical protein